MGFRLYLECQKKRIQAEHAYKVIPSDDDVFDEVVLYTENCIHKGSNNLHCKNCLGVCVQVKKEVFNITSGSFEIKNSLIRDKLVVNKNKQLHESHKATKYIGNISKIFSLNSKEYKPNEAKITIPWTAYDRPDSWANDCPKCRDKHKEDATSTPCELATEFIKQNPMSQLPKEFICTSQRQKRLDVY